MYSMYRTLLSNIDTENVSQNQMKSPTKYLSDLKAYLSCMKLSLKVFSSRNSKQHLIKFFFETEFFLPKQVSLERAETYIDFQAYLHATYPSSRRR